VKGRFLTGKGIKGYSVYLGIMHKRAALCARTGAHFERGGSSPRGYDLTDNKKTRFTPKGANGFLTFQAEV
jgi:hypothetical protein